MNKTPLFRHKLIFYAGLNYTEYNNLRELCFLEYCQKLSAWAGIPAHAIESNDLMVNYYADQWHAMELKIKEEQDNYLDQLGSDAHASKVLKMICRYADKINKYPKIILTEIKKKNESQCTQPA